MNHISHHQHHQNYIVGSPHQHHHLHPQQQQQQQQQQQSSFHNNNNYNRPAVAVTRPNQYHGKVKKFGSSNCNMSNYETNPVGALQERFQSRGITPQYRVVQAEGASHAPTFSFQVILGDLTATGSGSSKKQAKHVAARAMLDKLDGRIPAQDGQTPLPPVNADNANGGAQAPGNTVGSLQELCVKHGYPMPTYDLGAVGGQPHMRNFTLMCCVGKMRENGTGGSKKDAKREAAQKMIDKLKTMGPNGGPMSVSEVTNQEQAVDEELLTKMSTMKVETLNSAASQKVASFYRKLQSSGGGNLAKLHMAPLKGKNVDFVGMLGELGKEQKFEVTYVEVEEKNDEDQTQCLVQLSTLPVAVCYGVGTDTKSASSDAARNALNYLKMMTKRTAQGGKK